MITAIPLNDPVTSRGRTQLLIESNVNIKPPMAKILNETYDVQLEGYTVFKDKVLVKGIVEKTFFFKHPHLGKKEDDKKGNDKKGAKQKGDKKKGDKGEENENKHKKDKKSKSNWYASSDWLNFLGQLKCNQNTDEQSASAKKENDDNSTDERHQKKEEENTADGGRKLMNGWCKRIGQYEGIVHYCQENFEFAGIVEMPGISPGDNCYLEQAEVKNYDKFIPTENDDNGLVNAGKQMFIIDIALKATKGEKKALKNQLVLVDSWDV